VGWASAAGLLAAFAAWLVVPHPAARRLAPPTRSLPHWLAPVPDALSAGSRGLAGGALAAAVAAWSGHLGMAAVGLGLAAGAAGFVVLGRVPPAGRARREMEITASLPQACDLLAVAVEAGLPLRAAVEAVAPTISGPLGDALAAVAARTRLGMPESDAWAELGTEPPLQALARELSRTVSTGTGMARLLRELGEDARRAGAAAAVVRARRVGVRSVLPLMVCFLPSFVLLGVVPVIGGIVQTLIP